MMSGNFVKVLNDQDVKANKNSTVTSRCLAVVLTSDRKVRRVSENDSSTGARSSDHKTDPSCNSPDGLAHEVNNDTEPKIPTVVQTFLNSANGPEIFEDFRSRNQTCYWNPALVDSVKGLDYLGFVYPYTLLIGGTDIHLENIRIAWGRRVLKPPQGYNFEKIGDVSRIEMEDIPQNHFIPLPEALCLVIMELNNRTITATCDMIRDRLQLYYGRDVVIPNEQLIFDILGNLIHERKLFHTGSGYFVVTPDTFRMRSDTPTQSYPAWTPYHPMYIPTTAPAPNKQRMVMRSISCQVDISEKMSQMQGYEKHIPHGVPTLDRSQSLKVQPSKAKENCVDFKVPEIRTLDRKPNRNKAPLKDINLLRNNANKDKDKGEKVSLFTKIFGKKKKPLPVTVKETEYATFSAQFPPPEWAWYQQQRDRHERIGDWVKQQQVGEPDTWAEQEQWLGSGVGPRHKDDTFLPPYDSGSNKQGIRESVSSQDDQFRIHKPRRSKSLPRIKNSQKSAKPTALRTVRSGSSDKNDVESLSSNPGEVKVTQPEECSPPAPPSDHGNVSNCVLHEPAFSLPWHSTPIRQPLQNIPVRDNGGVVLNSNSHACPQTGFARRAHRARRKQLRHSCGNFAHYRGTDISCEYQGKLQKQVKMSKSRDSGVNCIGLGANVPQTGLQVVDDQCSNSAKNSESTDPSIPSSTGGYVHCSLPSVTSVYANSNNPSASAHYVNVNSLRRKHKHKSKAPKEVTMAPEPIVVPPVNTNMQQINVCVHREFEDIPEEASLTTNVVSCESSNSTEGLDVRVTASEQSLDTIIKRVDNDGDNQAHDGVELQGKVDMVTMDSGFMSTVRDAGSVDVSQPDNSANCADKEPHYVNVWKNTEKCIQKQAFVLNNLNLHGPSSQENLTTKDSNTFPLNNQRQLSKESNLDRQRSLTDLHNDLQEKYLHASRKFNFRGEFEVVGVL